MEMGAPLMVIVRTSATTRLAPTDVCAQRGTCSMQMGAPVMVSVRTSATTRLDPTDVCAQRGMC